MVTEGRPICQGLSLMTPGRGTAGIEQLVGEGIGDPHELFPQGVIVQHELPPERLGDVSGCVRDVENHEDAHPLLFKSILHVRMEHLAPGDRHPHAEIERARYPDAAQVGHLFER